MKKKRSIIYIDGFNLYYGAVKGTPYKWLNLERFFTLLRQDDDIQAIKYFTALIDGSHRSNQETYLLALATLPLVHIYLGKFKTKSVKCLVPACRHIGSRFFRMQEEKRTDVNIAVHMLADAFNDSCERLVVVSGDSDLVPAIRELKRNRLDREVIVYVPANDPTRGAAVEIRAAADKAKTLPNILLQKAQFPAKLRSTENGWIEKPVFW